MFACVTGAVVLECGGVGAFGRFKDSIAGTMLFECCHCKQRHERCELMALVIVLTTIPTISRLSLERLGNQAVLLTSCN